MAHTIPELKRLQRGDTARIGQADGSELEWLVLSNLNNRLLLLCERELKSEWMAQHGKQFSSDELNKMIVNQWRYEWFDWMMIDSVCKGPAQKFLPGKTGIRPLVEIDLSMFEYHPKEEGSMFALDTTEQLIQHGMDAQKARRLVRLGIFPPQLTVSNDTNNLELLAKYMDLNSEPHPDRIVAFLKRDFAVNQRMEIVPQWFEFPAEVAQKYLSQPLEWQHDVYDWFYGEEALKQITQDKALIHEILMDVFTQSTYAHTGRFYLACEKLAFINTDQSRMDALLKKEYALLFSDFSDTPACIELLVKMLGRENALTALERNPLLSRQLISMDRSMFRNLSQAEIVPHSSQP